MEVCNSAVEADDEFTGLELAEKKPQEELKLE